MSAVRLVRCAARAAWLSLVIGPFVPSVLAANFTIDSSAGTINGMAAGDWNGTHFEFLGVSGSIARFRFEGDLIIGASDIVSGTGPNGISLVVANNVDIASGALLSFNANGRIGGPGGGSGGNTAAGGPGTFGGPGGPGGPGGGGGAGGFGIVPTGVIGGPGIPGSPGSPGAPGLAGLNSGSSGETGASGVNSFGSGGLGDSRGSWLLELLAGDPGVPGVGNLLPGTGGLLPNANGVDGGDGARRSAVETVPVSMRAAASGRLNTGGVIPSLTISGGGGGGSGGGGTAFRWRR
jgi:hypothetical protein